MAKRYHDTRRAQEKAESKVIGSGDFANMPSNVIMKQYPMAGSPMDSTLDDSITGIDRQISKDDSMRNKHLSPHKL